MSRYDSAVYTDLAYADLARLRAPSRFRFRRQPVPGSLRRLRVRRSRSDVGMVCMVMIAAVVASGLFVVPCLMRTTPEAPVQKANTNLLTDRRSEPAATVRRIAPAAAQPVRSEAAALAGTAAPALTVAARPERQATRDGSPFRVESLAVLEDDGAFDPDQLAAAAATPATRMGQRRAADAATRPPQP